MMRFKIVIGVFWLFAALCSYGQEVDRYAKIATQLYDTREHLLEEQKPIPLANKFLPVNHDPSASFTPVKHTHTDAELDSLLQQMREQYAPYMEKLAPGFESKRQRMMLKTFKWKVKDENQSFESVLNGEGDWKDVNIPHYDEPLGRSVTYYYKEIDLSGKWFDPGSLYLCFKGVDYKAHVFVNGEYIGSHEGFFAPFEFNISATAKTGKNKILVKVENDFTMHGVKDKHGNKVIGDKIYAATGPGYDDPEKGWHHCPPAMGIFQDCFIESRSKLHVNDIFVRPLPDDSKAEAWIEVNNDYSLPKNIKLDLSLYGQNFTDTVFQNLEYKPFTKNVKGLGDLDRPTDGDRVGLPMIGGYVNYLKVTIDMDDFKMWEKGSPWLYELQVGIQNENGETLDVAAREFGMRKFTMDTVSTPKGMMYLNDEKIRLRGANTMGHLQNCVINKNWDQLRDDILLAKIANMNFLRFTQRPVQKEIYEYCDMLGMLNQTDLPMFGILTRNQFAEALKQTEEMERLVRSHPSAIMVSYMNEKAPNAAGFPQRGFNKADDFDKAYKAFDQAILLNNPDRVIKSTDGDYDPPSPGLPDNHCYNFWYNGHGLGVGKMYRGYWMHVKPGWYYGCGEFGAEGLDRVSVMKKYYPKEWLPNSKADEESWTPDKISKAQTPKFHHMWYNTPHSMNDWVEASQNHQAWAVRLTTEAFRRDPRMVSFAVHLFIDAWPAGWMKTIMDVERQPKKAYWEYKEALKPLIVSLRSDRDKYFRGDSVSIELWVCNDKNEVPENFTLKYQLVKGEKTIFANHVSPEIPSNSAKFNGFIDFKAPKVNQRSEYTLYSALVDGNNRIVDQSEFSFEVFPEINYETNEIETLEKDNEIIESVATEMGYKTKMKDGLNTIVIQDYELYIKDSVRINKAVNDGAKVVFMDFKSGSYQIANSVIEVSPTEMGTYFFVSPQTGHEMVKEFKSYDFRFWYDPKVDYIAPILSHYFKGDGWKPILSTGSLNWVEAGEEMIAVGELKYGNGSFIVCQIDMSGKLNSNPTAKIFTGKLLD
jgi:hypothetical protein